MKISVVVPTIREESITRFLDEWKDIFANHDISLLIIEDNPEKSFNINPDNFSFNVSHYSWHDIENDLGDDAWVISRRSSAIKCYGFWKAYKQGFDLITSFDDDCYPLGNYINDKKDDYFEMTKRNLFKNNYSEKAWDSSIKKIRPRGLPYDNLSRKVESRDIILNHGLWANVPDLDGKTQLEMNEADIPSIETYFKKFLIPVNKYFPMCGMNLTWKRELTPAMYFLLMGNDSNDNSWGYNRFDDIWAGIFIKKICDHLGYRIISGSPVVWHDRASDPKKNFKKEKPGMKVNEELWRKVDEVNLESDNVKDCYIELAEKINMDHEYIKELQGAMKIWAKLF